MKHLYIIGFTLLATLSHSQTTPTKKKLNIDSLMRVEDEKRNQWIGKIYPNFFCSFHSFLYLNYFFSKPPRRMAGGVPRLHQVAL